MPGTPRPTASQYRGGTGDECSFGCGPLAHDMSPAIVSTYVRRFEYFVPPCSDALPSLKLPSRKLECRYQGLAPTFVVWPPAERTVTGTTADRIFLPECPTTSPISVLEAARKVHLDIHHPALASSGVPYCRFGITTENIFICLILFHYLLYFCGCEAILQLQLLGTRAGSRLEGTWQ